MRKNRSSRSRSTPNSFARARCFSVGSKSGGQNDDLVGNDLPSASPLFPPLTLPFLLPLPVSPPTQGLDARESKFGDSPSVATGPPTGQNSASTTCPRPARSAMLILLVIPLAAPRTFRPLSGNACRRRHLRLVQRPIFGGSFSVPGTLNEMFNPPMGC